MISQPSSPMLDRKLFVSRFDDPFPDLYERQWDGVEWIWINHGRPEGHKMISEPGGAMLDSKLFVVVDDGSLWERHQRSDDDQWAWHNHGRPENRKIVHGPGAAMLNEKLFVVTEDGNLWERHWRNDLNRWAWHDHERPAGQKIITSPACAMMNEKLFVVTESGDLWERHWREDLGRWSWENHGRPNSEKIKYAPGAAMNDEKLFIVTETGSLWERHWSNNLGRWAWQDHGRPNNQRLIASPGAAMMDEKLFVGAEDGHLYERHWREDLRRWAWEDHGTPPDARVATAPGAATLNSKLFVGASNGHLFERVWTGSAWEWVDHGTAFHDQSAHIIGRPGRDPKLTLTVMGDGYAEGDMDEYRQTVEQSVLGAFDLDTLSTNHDKVRIIRVDVVSPVSGVTHRDFDQSGTTGDSSDDILLNESVVNSRLGFISTGIWSHCWLETSDRTNPRITSLRQRFAPDATNVIVLVNTSETGGCNRGDTAAFSKGESEKVVAHELGHNLFDLGDEYNNDTRNNTAVRNEANLTEALTDWTTLKWGDLAGSTTPLPTDASALPSGWDNETSVGAFEGGGGNFSTGIFRPVLRCRMNQNSPPWCPVCRREIERILGEFS